MPSPALRFLEYVFLALLYLFILRVVRAVWVELREPRLVPMAPGPPNGAALAAPVVSPATRGGGRSSPKKLVVVEPDKARGTSFPLEGGELTIGRAAGCAVTLPDDSFVSQVHARVFRRGEDYWVEDLGSTNGTLVNGRKLDAAVPVRRGDRLQVGRSVLELQK